MATTTYVDRFLEPMTEALTPEVAHVIANLRVDLETEAEVQRLRERANEGTLTSAEEEAYRDFVEAVDVNIVTFLRMQLRLSRARVRIFSKTHYARSLL